MRGLWWIPYLGLTTHRPNGPGDPSPGLRPKADALGNKGNKPPILAA
jgi:hypothetical protein